jgi:hypothetical protein
MEFTHVTLSLLSRLPDGLHQLFELIRRHPSTKTKASTLD